MPDELYVVSYRSSWDAAIGNNDFIDLPAADRDRYIYRIVSLKRLFELFSSRTNILVKPKKWDDPFENFILRSRIRLPSGEIYHHGNRDAIYGQCWTLQSASDAMWRIYSPQGEAVRIRTTPKRLVQSMIEASAAQQSMLRIGRVRYLSQTALVRFARRSLNTREDSYSVLAKTLLVKRLAFRHEREVRALIFAPVKNAVGPASDLLQCAVDPHFLIDQIMLDPRYSAERAESVKKEIASQTQFRGEILRSLLYAPPPRLLLDFAMSSRGVCLKWPHRRVG